LVRIIALGVTETKFPDWINDITQLRAGTLNLQGFETSFLQINYGETIEN
jgi:hypothetical protein